jgi:aryl-alcohol dehydrogenase-like predicted oxidoreductase
MDFRLLGRSGLRVANVCLGAMTFGEEFGIGADAAGSRRVFDAYVEAGGNFIDTANIYNRGTSERLLGGFITGLRERLVVATKYTLTTDGTDPNAGGSHRKNLRQSLDASLARLQTNYVDLLWVHGHDRHTRLDELMRALDDEVRRGRVLALGISNVPAWVVATANTLASERGLTPFSALQLHYNLVERHIEASFFDLARAFDLAITAWSPLAGGLLSGKYTTAATAGRLAGPRGARTLTPANQAVATALAELAGGLGCTPAQLALAWVLKRGPDGVIPIVGARTAPQLMENLGCVGVNPGPEVLATLDALAPPPVGYPEALLAGEFFQTMMHGPVREQVRWPQAGAPFP